MNLGISQKYFIVALPKKGQFSVSNTKAPVGVGLLVAGLIDLQMGGVIQIENKKITVISGLTDELKYLKPLYDVLKTKEKMSIMNLTNIYVTSILKNPFSLYQTSIFDSLQNTDTVLVDHNGKWQSSDRAKEQIISDIRSSFLIDTQKEDEQIIILTTILDPVKVLKLYFSKEEIKVIRQRIKEIGESDSKNIVKEMLASIDGFSVAMLVPFL
ncbi:GOLPH3/VPS74 family protein [Granulicatella seriolae]|uniref:GPP34 family phosphoprotein n=1 Tax=Granulicatella seriolae TaxID=2967226 RepID=A0ABT1WKY3_9LACT|nr:GPP34 family phosphoprotein [Granulicatella seriolae]